MLYAGLAYPESGLVGANASLTAAQVLSITLQGQVCSDTRWVKLRVAKDSTKAMLRSQGARLTTCWYCSERCRMG